MRNKQFGESQYQFARYGANVIDYAFFQGYKLVRRGSRYTMREHDSMVFLDDGRWFWNSRGLRGRAIEFAMNYEGKSLPEAVLAICAMRGAQPQAAVEKHEMPHADKKPFELPTPADSCKRLFAYLCTTRQLDRGIVADLIRNGDLYESYRQYIKSDGEIGEVHNAVFIGRDRDGTARSAFQRGLSSFPNSMHFKGDVAGSDPSAAFLLRGMEQANTVIVFEAAIDALSHATLLKLAGHDYKSCDRIALGGTEKTAGLLTYLETHPQVRNVILAFDEDTAGTAAASHARTLLSDRGYYIMRAHPSHGKDWNDYLRIWRADNP